MKYATVHRCLAPLLLVSLAFLAQTARADVVTDWNKLAVNLTFVGKIATPPANRMIAIVQASVYEAVNTITKRYPTRRTDLTAPAGTSIDAAIASANYFTLARLLPSAKTSIDSAYQAALSVVPEGQEKTDGIAVGEKAAVAILTMCENDGSGNKEDYRPNTAAGIYVPTTLPVTPQWPQRRTWIMNSADQFRPGPPPTLASELWARDFAEVKAMGNLTSTQRNTEQTEVAQFWEATGPIIYFPLAHSVANAPGRDVTQNARLLAVVAEAMDDAIVSVFDAKYHYGFWRPITAIRNGDVDGNDATERDSSWRPFIETPMHPEYPCAHCIVASAVAAVLEAEVGPDPMPAFSTTSPTAPGVVHRWSKLEDFVREVSEARICDGVHYRNSTEVANAMGKKIGELAASKYLVNSR